MEVTYLGTKLNILQSVFMTIIAFLADMDITAYSIPAKHTEIQDNILMYQTSEKQPNTFCNPERKHTNPTKTCNFIQIMQHSL